MKQTETLQEFYTRVPQANPTGLSLNNAGPGHFNIFSRDCCFPKTSYIRRDFYKISLQRSAKMFCLIFIIIGLNTGRGVILSRPNFTW